MPLSLQGYSVPFFLPLIGLRGGSVGYYTERCSLPHINCLFDGCVMMLTGVYIIIRVAELLVTLPYAFDTLIRKVDPLSASAAAGVVYVTFIAPGYPNRSSATDMPAGLVPGCYYTEYCCLSEINYLIYWLR